jgi:hypothetical protein
MPQIEEYAIRALVGSLDIAMFRRYTDIFNHSLNAMDIHLSLNYMNYAILLRLANNWLTFRFKLGGSSAIGTASLPDLLTSFINILSIP